MEPAQREASLILTPPYTIRMAEVPGSLRASFQKRCPLLAHMHAVAHTHARTRTHARTHTHSWQCLMYDYIVFKIKRARHCSSRFVAHPPCKDPTPTVTRNHRPPGLAESTLPPLPEKGERKQLCRAPEAPFLTGMLDDCVAASLADHAHVEVFPEAKCSLCMGMRLAGTAVGFGGFSRQGRARQQLRTGQEDGRQQGAGAALSESLRRAPPGLALSAPQGRPFPVLPFPFSFHSVSRHLPLLSLLHFPLSLVTRSVVVRGPAASASPLGF